MSSFVGIIPESCSFTESHIESFATTPFMRKALSAEERRKGLIFKGPFVVKHPRFSNPILAVDLRAVDNNLFVFDDGDKFFEIRATGKVRWSDNHIVIPYKSENGRSASVRIRRLMESDISSFSDEKLSLDAFARKMYKYLITDAMALGDFNV